MISIYLVVLVLLSLLSSLSLSFTLPSSSKLLSNRLSKINAQTTKTEDTSNEVQEYSFVQDDLRTYAMKLHTRDQAPKEGQQKAETPFTAWEPSRQNYIQFLVDSLVVYETMDSIIASVEDLAQFKSTGLERAVALREDIKWMSSYDDSIIIPDCGHSGKAYASFLTALAKESIPKFMCHYYNHYFAHTAGGRMIGKKMADKLLEGKILKFYQWEGDVKVLLDETRKKIDVMALKWTPEEKQACLEETMACFRYGGSLMVYMKAPGSGHGH